MDKAAEILPGVAASAVVMQGGFMGADVLGKGLLYLQGIDSAGVASPISGIPVSILLGLAIGNSVKLPERLSPGIKFAQKTVLQAGVVCVGAKLSALDLVTTGAIGLPAVCLSIGAGMTFVPWFGDKMGLPHKMSSLIAAGTSICGELQRHTAVVGSIVDDPYVLLCCIGHWLSWLSHLPFLTLPAVEVGIELIYLGLSCGFVPWCFGMLQVIAILGSTFGLRSLCRLDNDMA